ncbi:hypothetical protein GCM10009087_11750 [Sphingomonas oligophenolica]|uniref:MBL fold metallo-hydrolase n=1 Tax=Sphingomonas oligophenolica TaxID=301154 RepID=A0ABU9Y450_9SPHN
MTDERHAAEAGAEAAADGGVLLNLFCHGLGDCHLLGLPATAGGRVWMLIDCGLHGSTKGGSDRMRIVKEALRRELGDKEIAVVALTHEHWDHNSGFHPTRGVIAAGAPPVGEVWLAWTEDAACPLGGQLDKYKGQAFAALDASEKRIAAVDSLRPLSRAWDALLGFYRQPVDDNGPTSGDFALKGEVTRTARDAAASLAAPKPPRYLHPGDVLTIPGVDAVRCYVLAPPRDTKLLGLLDSVADTFSAASGQSPVLGALANALAVNAGSLTIDEDEASPFDGSEGMSLSKAKDEVAFLREHYSNEPDRMIEHDWLVGATDLALQLDAKTNNTSLVLALEIVATGHVLLFAADAQVGNWQSWAKVEFKAVPGRPGTTGADLLARTVFYKVGHHGSRNATLKEGLERMNALEIAFNPTDQAMAKKVGWGDIPASKLNAELERRTKGRLIQSDAAWIRDRNKPIPIAPGGVLASIERSDGPSLKLIIT